MTEEGVQLGRFLFYDSILSKDYSISCSSCHKQEFAFSDSPNRLSKGSLGFTNRNTMPLFNLAWYPSFFWDGRATSLENQVFEPVRNHSEMNLEWKEAEKRVRSSPFYRKKFRTVFTKQKIDSTLISMVIAQFERTLLSYNSKFDRVIRGQDVLTKEEYEGFILMNDQTKGDCLHCHTTDANPLGTTLKFSNNGLDKADDITHYLDKGLGGFSKKESDIGVFKIPSVRNLGFTSPYMHDGRFETLEEVLEFYSSGVHNSINVDSKMEFAYKGGNGLSKEEQKKIIAFLNTMNDSVFIEQKIHSNPFKP